MTDLVDREMQYDAAGNVTKIVDGVNSETVDYTYDDLDRLLTASVPTGESFAYDTIGNMTAKAGTTLDYGTTSPKHAVKSHGTTAYTYDANGSMTARGTQTIKYDPEQRPILVRDGSSVHRAAYDGDGVRRKRDDSNGTVHYLGAYERKLAGIYNSPETITKYYSASLGALSRPVAFRRGCTLHWVGSDHLGGTIRVVDSSFTAVDGMRYKPYGEDRDTGSSLNTDRKFTGQTEDEAAGLYWYASRAYDPEIGRFVSPDSIVPDPSNPQSLNRYAYVRNNPLKFVDPSGHSDEWLSDAWISDFREVHRQAPDDSDYAFRIYSMTAASLGLDWSVKDWTARLNSAKNSIENTFEQAKSSIGNAFEQAKASIENTITPVITTATNVGQTIVDTYESISTPGTHYIVQEPDGYEFAVRENMRTLKAVNVGVKAVGLGEGIRAVVLVQNEVWSAGPAEYGSKGFLHEREHLMQIRELGRLEYWRLYEQRLRMALDKTGGSLLEAQKIHLFEVLANRLAGLPDDWIQSGLEDWLAP